MMISTIARRHAAVWLAAAAATTALAGCSGNSGSSNSGPGTSPGGSGRVGAQGGNGAQLAGVPATSLSCDRFPPADLLAAVRTMTPTAQMKVAPPPVGTADDGLQCSYTLYTPGTDLSSADYGEVDISVQIQDAWPDILLDGKHDDKNNRDAFADGQQNAKVVYNGSTEESSVGKYYELGGVGQGAFIEDTVQQQDDGTPEQWTTDVEALHVPRPYKIEVGLSFVIPQPDQPVPDTSLVDAMRGQSFRTNLAKALTQVVFTKLDAKG